ELTDCQVAFIAEHYALDPSSRAIKRERLPNAFEVLLSVIDEAGLVMPFEYTVVCAVWTLHTYVFHQFLHTPRLLIHSRGSGYGKTALLSCIAGLSSHSRYVVAPS